MAIGSFPCFYKIFLLTTLTDFLAATNALSDGELMKVAIRSCRNRNKDNATIKRLLDYELGLPE